MSTGQKLEPITFLFLSFGIRVCIMFFLWEKYLHSTNGREIMVI